LGYLSEAHQSGEASAIVAKRKDGVYQEVREALVDAMVLSGCRISSNLTNQ
jgi:hypothetical protein